VDTLNFPDSSVSSSFSISPQQLAGRLGRADAPLVLDVRREAKFSESRHLIAGARRCAPEDVAAFAATQLALDPAREIVVYCVYGHNVSQDAAATLRAAGLNAHHLAGGMEGGEEGVDTPEDISTWRANALLVVIKRPDWGVTGEQLSRWITRARPKIDRIACPWLIRRFIDAQAAFFYVPTAQVLAEAKRLGAVAFDIPGAPVSHEGELCSFDVLLAAFGLRDAALDRLARIVRGADTDCLGLAPESAGLLALSLGLSQLHSEDDHAMLEAAMPLYDALHAWCQSTVSAAKQGTPAETHNWKPEAMTGAKA
jgi:rhodanese-related sulfurtransferase